MPVDKFGRMSETKTEDEVPRSFVNGEIRALKEQIKKIEKRKHLIAVHARYCGPLKEGEYPFKFGGNSLETCDETFKQKYELNSIISGFVMPHSGRIKKIICEGISHIEFGDIADKVINLLNEEQINELKKKYGKDFKEDIKDRMLSWGKFFMFSFEKEKKILKLLKL